MKIPIVPKFEAKPGDFDDLLLIGFDKTHLEDNNHLDRMVHFFLYDYRFERVWKNPDNDIEKLSRYRAVLSPDFSIYLEMAPVMQIYNVFRNRWCGAYWASKGIRVIPSVNWGDESTFDFCFQGIEKGSTVAVSTYMASESEHHKDQKEWYMAGYNEMLRQIEPERIICYNTPFPEMTGNIVYVDYDRSSWRYMNYERSYLKDDLDCYKIGGTIRQEYDIMAPYRIGKGGGSAFGGGWQPSKSGDQRLVGEPGSINETYTKNGELYQTHIGQDGYADMERHNTDHGRDDHTNPHDHKISWEGNHPNWGGHIDYEQGQAPDFEGMFYGGNISMSGKRIFISDEDNRFQSISEFKWCLMCGGEIEFCWNGKTYGVIRYGTDGKITVYEANNKESERVFDSSDDALEYMIGDEHMRDIITQVEVMFRSI